MLTLKTVKIIFFGIYICSTILLRQNAANANSSSPENFSTLTEWCLNQTNISPTAQHTIKILLQKARTKNCIEAEEKLSRLYSLSLNNNQIRNIAPISTLKNITQLSLNDNQILELSTLSQLPKLTYLSLDDNRIRNISDLSTLTNLTHLSLNDNKIKNLSPLSNLTQITHLDLIF